ncbi:MAG: hypothetical protein WDM96_12120 [Lacunisphaera sp.]
MMFAPSGDVLQPSEVIYNRPVLVERRQLPARSRTSRRHAQLRHRAVPPGAVGQGQGTSWC